MFRAACLLLLFVGSAAPTAYAEEIAVRNATLVSAEEGAVLNAEFAFMLRPRHVEAIVNGVPLYFAIEFELKRPRWYWFDEAVLMRRLQLRLSYHPLSRQYRLSTGVLQQDFPSLDEALAVMRRTQNWLVIERGIVAADVRYDAAVRMRLDTGLLSRPVQLSAIASRDWGLDSAWHRFVFKAPQQLPAPVETRTPVEVRQR